MPATPALDLDLLRAALEPLPWAERFERLAAEDKGHPSPERRAAIEALRTALGDQALDELRAGWGGLPLKEAILRLPSKRLRGALGRAAKRARDRSVVDICRRHLRAATGLPVGRFGVGMDERVVEIPLALRSARLDEPGEVLDAGSALNLPVVREIVGRPAARVIHVTLPGSEEPALPGHEDRFVRAFCDLRALPFQDERFDRVACISTLEHVGMDNTRFGAAAGERAPESAARAVEELMRVLAPGGELIVTVPFGQAADHGWFRVLDTEGWRQLTAPLAGHEVESRFFHYDAGWSEGGDVAAAGAPPPYAGDVVTGVAVACARKRGRVR